MRRRFGSVLAVLGLLVGVLATAPTAGAAAGNHGTFWVFDGNGGTGQSHGFDVYPGRTQTLTPSSATKYVTNCPPGVGCTYMNNTISSIQLSCGGTGFLFGSADWVDFYNLDVPSGTAYRITTAGTSCVNGVRTITFDSAHQNWAGSFVTHDG
jgi:hypothetical protein